MAHTHKGFDAKALQGKSVRDCIDEGASAHPKRVFFIQAETGEALDWQTLQAHARLLDVYLHAKGVPHGAKVAVMLDNSYWATVLFLGLMYSGRVVLMLNTVSGRETLHYVLTHSESTLLFISTAYRAEFSSMIEGAADQLSEVVEIKDASDPCADFLAERALVDPDVKTPQADEVALLMYTSGTTGQPKGVLLTHQNVLAGGRNTAVAHALSAEDVALCVLPLYHINAQMVTVMAPLVSGGQLVMRKKFSAQRFWGDIARYRCTWFSVVPTIISYLIEHGLGSMPQAEFDMLRAQVRFGRSASQALSPAKHQQFEALFGMPIVETMGLTETAAQILSNPMPPAQNQYGSPGCAVGNEACIMDKTGAVLPAGKIGELMIRGDNVMQGYYKNQGATEEALNTDGWLHTGDLAYQGDHGFFFITGRLKELIIKGGENIAPREIDDVLYRHPAVSEAAAFGIEDEHYGQEVMAAVALSPGMDVSADELRDLCVKVLGNYKAPKVVFIRDALPKGPSGKIQRLKLSA